MQHKEHSQPSQENHYLRLAGMAVLSFISIYLLMYSMVDSFGDVYNSLNQVYMAGLMTAPMVVIEMLLMSAMYKNKKPNAIIIGMSCAMGIAFFVFIRQQTAISDRRSPVLAVDDPPSCRSNPDVRGRVDSRRADRGAV